MWKMVHISLDKLKKKKKKKKTLDAAWTWPTATNIKARLPWAKLNTFLETLNHLLNDYYVLIRDF